GPGSEGPGVKRPGAEGWFRLRPGRPLPGRRGGRHHPRLECGRRADSGGGGPGGGLAQAGDLPRAVLAPGQVTVEPGPVRRGDCVHRVRPGEGVNVARVPHDATPRQSRSRISASRIRVLIVPPGTPSRLATWL